MSSLSTEVSPVGSTGSRAARPVRHFYLGMAIIIALIIGAAFARAAISDLSHPLSPRPWILHFHVALCSMWVLLFLGQTLLIDRNRLAWHRTLGSFGVVVGTLLPIAGMATAVALARYHIAEGRASDPAAVIGPLSEMAAFGFAFGLAVWWRSRPEYHRRLMLLASCILTLAAFPPVLSSLSLGHTRYLADVLMLAGPGRDWIASRRIHPVYLYGLPIFVLWQLTVRWIYVSEFPMWVSIAHTLVQ